MTKNFYPELPEVPYEKTSVDMHKVIEFAQTQVAEYGIEYVKSAYAIFRNESANGSRGVNNNYAGIQADNARWTQLPGTPIATCIKIDSGHEERRFLCFGDDGYKISFQLLCIKCVDRVIVDGFSYYRRWVGRKTLPTTSEVSNFNSMRNQFHIPSAPGGS